MPTKLLNKDELKQKVTDRVLAVIEKYSYSAERGMEELEKEINLVHLQADNTEFTADERMINIMLETVILTAYGFEIEKQL